ncbi:hypothetical protein CTI12_AA585530 [Artemisia annua]|uniref:Uncharacterized protein n=1 Tax=Artemisia annua TaxID=35608 RepID=A0A2U1KMI2_ARTAN|nr:hypothetical protein CTI12_AA585530 [Artemisia annua]
MSFDVAASREYSIENIRATNGGTVELKKTIQGSNQELLLRERLEMMGFGDQTEFGERGINLSGVDAYTGSQLLKEESSENVADSYWCEPNENRSEFVAQTNEHDGELLRNDMPPVVVDANASLADVDEVDHKSEESDYDDTLWDWMSGDEDNVDDI